MLHSQLSSWTIRTFFGSVLGHAADGVPGQPVVFRSRDGSALQGALISATRPARGVVVLCHPFNRRGLGYFARTDTPTWLARAGWHVALFNFKGFGGSEIRGVNFADDVVGVVGGLRARFGTLPISVVGLSFGGFHAVTALEQLDGEVASAWLDSVPRRASDFLGGAAGALTGLLARSRWAAATGTRPLDQVVGALRRTRLHLVYGERDPYCPDAAVDALERANPALRITRWPEATHLAAFKGQSVAYRSLLLSALAEAPESQLSRRSS